MSRKILSVIIILTILLSVISPAAAQEGTAKLSQEQALEIAKKNPGDFG